MAGPAARDRVDRCEPGLDQLSNGLFADARQLVRKRCVLDDSLGAITSLNAAAIRPIIERLQDIQQTGHSLPLLATDGPTFTRSMSRYADGQHDLEALSAMLDLAARHPDAVICGHPVYDDSIPTARRVGHWFTNAWIVLETLSLRITDGMCGFRVYPLAPAMRLMADEPLRARMDFDTDKELAIDSRRKVFDMVATDRLLLTGMHLHFPGFAHLVRDGSGFRLIPEAWQHGL